MRRLLIALLSCLLVTTVTALAHAHTGHGVGEQPQTANLDGGPELERVFTHSVCQQPDGSLTAPVNTVCPSGRARHHVMLEDTCAGAPRALALSNVEDSILRLRVVEADGDSSHQEVFLDARSGTTNRDGAARLIRMRDRADGGCPDVQTLFRFPSRSKRGALPRTAVKRAGWDAEVQDYTPRFAGMEVRVLETFLDRNDPDTSPTFVSSTYFRLTRAKDGYVRFRTVVRRIKD